MNNQEELIYNDILKGKFEHVFKDRSKTVRIFLSSTFTDTHEERDYLIENVFPKLKDYCKKEHGLDFQVNCCIKKIFMMKTIRISIIRFWI